MANFQPFLSLGAVLVGVEITDLVCGRMISEGEQNDLRNERLTPEAAVSSGASRFYESIRLAALKAMAETGRGVVICRDKAMHFVRAEDLRHSPSRDLLIYLDSLDEQMDALVVLERSADATVIRLGQRHRRAILGRYPLGGSSGEMLNRGLEYLLEHY